MCSSDLFTNFADKDPRRRPVDEGDAGAGAHALDNRPGAIILKRPFDNYSDYVKNAFENSC